jgi:hypothetical protein
MWTPAFRACSGVLIMREQIGNPRTDRQEDVTMKDTEMRRLVLERFYDLRNKVNPTGINELQSIAPSPDDRTQLENVCDQLFAHGLIDWQTIRPLNGPLRGFGRISASGVDIIENNVKPPIEMVYHDHSVKITGSSNVQVGNANSIQANIDITKIMEAIDRCDAPSEQKAEAKSLWSKLSNNAAFASIVGAVATLAGSAH